MRSELHITVMKRGIRAQGMRGIVSLRRYLWGRSPPREPVEERDSVSL